MKTVYGCIPLGRSGTGQDHPDHRASNKTDVCNLDKESTVPLMHHDPGDLVIINPDPDTDSIKERTLGLFSRSDIKMVMCFFRDYHQIFQLFSIKISELLKEVLAHLSSWLVELLDPFSPPCHFCKLT